MINGENIGKDTYGRDMYLSHSCSRVYCQHVKDGKVVRSRSIEVGYEIIAMFANRVRSGASIYDDIVRRYKTKL